jgi:AbrB family looped-hinge helix DNA binding protein
MISTIDSAGRLVIPKEARQQAGLQPGMPLEIRVRDGRIEIEPAPLDVRIERRGRMVVAVPKAAISALKADTVEQTRSALRHERRRGR